MASEPFKCECGEDRFLELKRYNHLGNVRPRGYAIDGPGTNPITVRCAKVECSKEYIFDLNAGKWVEQKA